MINALLEENQRNLAAGARQFIDLGRPAANVERDRGEISQSSLERRSQIPRGSSPQNEIIESMNCKSTINTSFRDQSGRSSKESDDHDQDQDRDHEASGQDDHDQQLGAAAEARWVPNKVARFNTGASNSRDEDQAASETMSMIRKARVSVRARSEAAMVIIIFATLFP